MRTLSEILDASKTGGEWPTHEECFWAMQALEQAWMMTQRKYQEQVLSPKSEALAKSLAENNFQMAKSCLGADPKTWLGPSRDYSNPENRKRREIALRLYELRDYLRHRIHISGPPGETDLRYALVAEQAASDLSRMREALERFVKAADSGHWRDGAGLSISAHPMVDDARELIARAALTPATEPPHE